MSTLLDETTAAAMREAVSAANRGEMREACRIGEQAIAEGGDAGALHAMLGTFYCRAGDLQSGIRHLEAAQLTRPSDPVIAANLASAHAQLENYEAALAAIPQALADADPSLRLLRLRGFAAQSAGHFAEAIAAYGKVLAAQPADWESWNNLGNSRVGAGDFEGGIKDLRHALELEPGSVPTRFNLAAALASAGHVEEAIEHYEAVAEADWTATRALRELHGLLRMQGRDEDALIAIQSAVERAPEETSLRLALASHRLAMLDTQGAETAYREVIARDPANALAHLGLAVTFDLANRTEDLAALPAAAAASGVPTEVLEFIRAFDHRRAKRYAEGLASLNHVPEDIEPTRRAQLLGQLSEGAGDYETAWSAFELTNRLQREDASEPEARAEPIRGLLRRRLDRSTVEWASRWQPFDSNDGRTSPVFLVGFPRSGTTLLDTMLMGHPQVEVLEEEPTIQAANRLFPDFDDLPAAAPAKIQAARDSYFEAAAMRTPMAPGTLLVDKNPLLMNALPLIYRLFPDARIILALRHPCDVVLSCFATSFKINEGTSNFLRLENAADLYDLSFTYFERCRELFPLPVHTVIYERLVADREAELRSLCGFLGVEWQDQLLDHEATAKRRGRIKTASYAQVSEPVYSRSAGRWQHYRDRLEPVIPKLRPWIQKFGYDL